VRCQPQDHPARLHVANLGHEPEEAPNDTDGGGALLPSVLVKLAWSRCFEIGRAALEARGLTPKELAQFAGYDVPAYGSRRPSSTTIPTEYLDWWPRSEATSIAQEVQQQEFWVEHRFRSLPTAHDVLHALYAAGHDDEYVVAVWIAAACRLIVKAKRAKPGKPLVAGTLPLARAVENAADRQLLRWPSWRYWVGGAVYVLPEQPEGFLANVPPDLDAVVGVIIDQVVKVHSKYVLVAMYPKGPLIPHPLVESTARAALRELDDDQFERVVDAERARRGTGRGDASG
jgi:hypothetical protein